jgi:hypothetical protein
MALTSALSRTYANFRFSVEGLTPKNARLESSRTRRALIERYESGMARPSSSGESARGSSFGSF